jgi:cholesterol transport system auxiliary component
VKPVGTLLAAALLAGCVASGPREADRYFILQAQPRSHPASSVLVAPMSVASFYDTQDIVYSRAPGTRAYYQYNHWTERPQLAIHALLASRLERDSPKKGLVLNTHLDEIYHDAAEPPGTARIAITAQLVDAGSRAVIARRSFSRAAPAATYDAPGAVRGFAQALGELLDEVVAWVDAAATRTAR